MIINKLQASVRILHDRIKILINSTITTIVK